MSGLEKQFSSCVKFLASVRPLAEYDELERRQITGIVSSLEKVSRLTPAQAATLLTVVDQSNLSTDAKTTLKTAVANKTQSGAEAKRRSMQDFSLLPFYLTSKLWQYVMDDSTDRKHVLQLICEHALTLGLRCPTEGCIAVIVALAYRKQLLGMSSKDKHTLLCSHKLAVKRVLGNSVDGSIYLESLPQVWSEVPSDLLKQAFPEEEKPAEPLVPVQDLLALAQSIPLRSSNADLTGEASGPASSSQQGMQEQAIGTVMAACLRAMSSGSIASSSTQRSTTPSQLAICDQENPEDLRIELLPKAKTEDQVSQPIASQRTVTDIPARESARPGVTDISVRDSAPSQEEMTDVRENTASRKGGQKNALPGKNASPKILEAQLQELRKDLSRGDQVTQQNKPGKKPAMALKKPCAAPSVTTATSALKKRPAALVDVKASKAQESRDEKRQRLLSVIPPNLKARYKNGCKKCRNRAFCTPSCWKARGFVLPP